MINSLPVVTLCVGEPDNVKHITPGDPVNVSDQEAQYLIQKKIAKACVLAIEPSSHADRIDAIIDAITELREDDFGKDGKPSVRALEKVLEHDISASERDHAWDEYQQLIDSDKDKDDG